MSLQVGAVAPDFDRGNVKIIGDGDFKLAASHRIATPVNWHNGDDVIIAGSVSDQEARTLYPDGRQAPRPYIRIVSQPNGSA